MHFGYPFSNELNLNNRQRIKLTKLATGGNINIWMNECIKSQSMHYNGNKFSAGRARERVSVLDPQVIDQLQQTFHVCDTWFTILLDQFPQMLLSSWNWKFYYN